LVFINSFLFPQRENGKIISYKIMKFTYTKLNYTFTKGWNVYRIE